MTLSSLTLTKLAQCDMCVSMSPDKCVLFLDIEDKNSYILLLNKQAIILLSAQEILSPNNQQIYCTCIIYVLILETILDVR